MDDSYNKYLVGDISQAEMCRNLAAALSSFPYDAGKKEFTVQVTSNKTGNEKFFGMRVYPDIEEMDNFCKDLVNEGDKIRFTSS